MYATALLILTLLFSSAPAHALKLQTKHEELVDRALSLSSTKTAMRQVSQQITRGFHAAREMSGVNSNRREMTPEQRQSLARLLGLMRTSFNHEALIDDTAAYLVKHASEAQLEAAVKLLSQKPVRRVVGMETKAMAAASPKVLNDFALELQRRKPSANRMSIVDHIDRITEASKLGTELAIEITGSFFHANPAQMTRLHEGIAKRAKDETLLRLLYAYRDLTDRELEAYAALYQDEDFAWVARMTSRGVNAAIKQAFGGFKGALVDWVTDQVDAQPRPF